MLIGNGAYAPVVSTSCMWASRAAADSQIGDLDEDIGVVEHPVPRAAEEAVLARCLRRDQALQRTLELIPPTGFGPAVRRSP